MVGAWIVQTLIYHDDVERPHRRTALVSWELDHFNFDIAALSETIFAGEGKLEPSTLSSGKGKMLRSR